MTTLTVIIIGTLLIIGGLIMTAAGIGCITETETRQTPAYLAFCILLVIIGVMQLIYAVITFNSL